MEFKGTKKEWFIIQFGSFFLLQDDDFYEANNIFDIEDVGEKEAKANIKLAKHAPEMLGMLCQCVELLENMECMEYLSPKIKTLIQKATTI